MPTPSASNSIFCAPMEEAIVSLQDVIEEDQQLEQTANAVLGASDDSSCTYPEGYVQRQALYACATCTGSSNTEVDGTRARAEGSSRGQLAGVCLACSLHCHEGHDLYELYTKRHFRCDCGNSKFGEMTCGLHPEKEPLNLDNMYNHNFRGLYCTCKRPYPDPEDEVEDEMIQCCVCEDWFHSRHLGGGEPPEEYEEMVCDCCMASRDFLKSYKLCSPVKVEGGEEGSGEEVVDVTTSEERSSKESHKDPSTATEHTAVSSDTGAESTAAEDGGSTGEVKTDQVCELAQRRKVSLGVTGNDGGSGYFTAIWRSQLCRCPQCISLYTQTHCLFLLDQSDTIASYEAKAAAVPTTQESAMTAFSTSLDRVHQVEALQQYNDMKTELVEFLQGFARGGKVVSRKDVEGFFEGMQARKRQRLDTGDGVPPASCHF